MRYNPEQFVHSPKLGKPIAPSLPLRKPIVATNNPHGAPARQALRRVQNRQAENGLSHPKAYQRENVLGRAKHTRRMQAMF